jgi:hypothetical protein
LAGVRTLVAGLGGILDFHVVECPGAGGADLTVVRADYDPARSAMRSRPFVDARPDLAEMTSPGLTAS